MSGGVFQCFRYLLCILFLGFRYPQEKCLGCVCVYFSVKCVGKIDGGSRTEAEEKVYSWLYALAMSDKDLVFEYVRSTERGECLRLHCLIFWFLRISFEF